MVLTFGFAGKTPSRPEGLSWARPFVGPNRSKHVYHQDSQRLVPLGEARPTGVCSKAPLIRTRSVLSPIDGLCGNPGREVVMPIRVKCLDKPRDKAQPTEDTGVSASLADGVRYATHGLRSAHPTGQTVTDSHNGWYIKRGLVTMVPKVGRFY